MGANDGVVLNAPVVTNEGLVGQVTRFFSRTARVTLITDEQSFVSAEDLPLGRDRRRPARRRRRHARLLPREEGGVGQGGPRGDHLRLALRTAFPSLYPRGIPIGEVTSVGLTSNDLYQQIQIRPYVDTSSLHSVIVLIDEAPRTAGP